MEGEGPSVAGWEARQPFLGGTYCSIDDEISFFLLISFHSRSVGWWAQFIMKINKSFKLIDSVPDSGY